MTQERPAHEGTMKTFLSGGNRKGENARQWTESDVVWGYRRSTDMVFWVKPSTQVEDDDDGDEEMEDDRAAGPLWHVACVGQLSTAVSH